MNEIKVLDHGYILHIESWGKGQAGQSEAGIIEAARQSTQGNFKGWGKWIADMQVRTDLNLPEADPEDFPRGDMSDSTIAAWMLAGQPDAFKHGMLDYSKFEWAAGDEKLLKYLYSNKHATPFEFAGMVIEVQAPIFVFREWHRHRTQSYNEMSARYAPMPNVHYMPQADNMFDVPGTNRQAGAVKGAPVLTHEAALDWLGDLSVLYEQSERVYKKGCDIGVKKEHARCAVTVARYSRMRASANLRNWLAFLTLRMDPAAQWEIRQFANAVAEVVAQEFPQTWALFEAGRK